MFSYTALMNSAIKTRNPQRAFELFDQMREARIQATAITYNTLIEIAISSNDIGKAIELYDQGSNLLAPTILSHPQGLDLHGASLAVSKAAILFLF